MRQRAYFLLILIILFLSPPLLSLGHEAYVLPQSFFWKHVQDPINPVAIQALQNPQDVTTIIEVTLGIVVLIFLDFIFRASFLGRLFYSRLEKLAFMGPVVLRATLATALFLGARSGAFLGPELPLQYLPFANLTQYLLQIISLMILFGIYTEIAALIGIAIFFVGFITFGQYLLTYANYLGELLILLIVGAREISFDKIIFGPLKNLRKRFEIYETLIIRFFYGFALMYAGITIKFLHPDLSLRVIHDWNLTQYHWLFPHDPLLVVFGAGIAEATIGLFIILGFEMRLSVLISLVYITLSLLFFRELVWPHILLYGISLNLLVQPGRFTLDNLIMNRIKQKNTP